MRRTTPFWVTLVVVAVLGAAAGPAIADNVTIAVDNPGGSRTLYVEDLAGQPLTTMDFGATRSQPFRVRVVDSTMDRTDFTVSATMTNLYYDTGSGLDFTDQIDSWNIALSQPANPLNALSVAARVLPVFNTVSTVGDVVICGLLSLPLLGGNCTVSLSNLTGKVQSVPLTVDLANLANLPLLPQGNQTGAFTNPAYAGVAAAAPVPPGAPTATSYRLIRGTAVSNATVLGALDTALASVLSPLPLASRVDTAVITSALRSTLGVVWDLLSAAQITTVLGGTVATVQSLLSADVLGQTGTYLSLPVLDVTVPLTATAGTYQGSLVVTGLQA